MRDVIPQTLGCTECGEADGTVSGSTATVQARMVNLAAEESWSAADTPAATTLVGLSMTVISGTAQVEDLSAVTVTDLPAGYSASWDAEPDGELTPPTSISADAASRVVITMTVRPD